MINEDTVENMAEKMKAVIYVQQKLIMNLQKDLEESNKCIIDLGNAINDHEGEDLCGIIVDDLFKLIMNMPFKSNGFDLSNIYPDIEYRDDDYNCFDDLIGYYDIKIEGYYIRTVCCRENMGVIMPKSYDLQGIKGLNKLRDKLVEADRIEDNPIGYLCKNCGCT